MTNHGEMSGNPVRREGVERAVVSLLKWRAKKSDSLKPHSVGPHEFLYIILTLSKSPTLSQTKPIKLPLPHPLFVPSIDGSELCLIYDDRPNSNTKKESVMRKIEEENIPITNIIKLSRLKSDYKAFEAKRKLSDSYDLFLADRRIIPSLPKILGKQFFKKSKIPVAVNLEDQNWKEEVEAVCRSAILYLRTGSCCVIKVGKVSMTKEHLIENVISAISCAGEAVPRKWGNVRSIHLKLAESLALPVYEGLPDGKLKIMKENDEMFEHAIYEKAEKKKKKKKDEGIGKANFMEDDDSDILGSRKRKR